jgi:hypothetical protein
MRRLRRLLDLELRFSTEEGERILEYVREHADEVFAELQSAGESRIRNSLGQEIVLTNIDQMK